MNYSSSFNTAEDEIQICGPLEIYQVDSFKKLFAQELQHRESITVDLAQITSCDAAGAQFLWALSETVRHEGGSFSITGASQPLVDCWAALGLPAGFFDVGRDSQIARNSYCI